MKTPTTVSALVKLGRVRLSKSFFMRDFLYSDIATIHCMTNLPEDPDTAIEAGKQLCELLLEPLQNRFGRLAIRSAYRSPEVNGFGNEMQKLGKEGYNCASNEANFAAHIWDRRDHDGHLGATACVIATGAIPYYEATGDWQAIAWWVHDHLPYNDMEFFPKFAAFNLSWNEVPSRKIYSRIPPHTQLLTKPGDANHEGSHEAQYRKLLESMDAAP